MHPLKQHRVAARISAIDLAAAAGTTRQTIHRIEAGDFMPRPALAQAIVAATAGAVSLDDLYGRVKKDAA